MAAIVTHKFRVHNAEQFYESFSESAASTYYLFVGRPQAFSVSTGGGTDSSPPTPNDSVVDEYAPWRDMIAAKKIASTDIQFVIPRRNWSSGTTYDIYRPDYSTTRTSNSTATNLYNATFYIMTSAYRVYKCTGNDSNTASTIEPTSTSNVEVDPGDGYLWKYMYTLTSTQTQNFLSTDFLPVTDTLGTVTAASQATVSTNAVDGEIRHIAIDTAGAGYTNGNYTSVPIRGDGSSGTCTVVVGSNAVTSVTVTAQGTGYTYAAIDTDNITSIGSPSTSAVLTPLVGPKGGHGYDALKELGAFYVMLNTSLVGAEGSGDFVIDQDFRKIGLIRNPYNYGTTTVSTAATLSALKSVTFSGSPGTFVLDEVITGGTTGAKGKVVKWDSTAKKLYYIQTEWTGIVTNKNLIAFAGTEVVTGAGGATGTMSAVNNPEIKYYSGDVMYIENRVPITRASDQTENIKLIIEF